MCSENSGWITALGGALHGSESGWHCGTGNFVATLEALLNAGAKPTKVTEGLEASEAVRDFVLEHEREAVQRSGDAKR